MFALGNIHHTRKEYEHAVEWFTNGAEAGLPKAMFNLGLMMDKGDGVAAPDYPAAADWYRRAADVGHADAARNLSGMYTVGRGMVCEICLRRTRPTLNRRTKSARLCEHSR
jgi:TPR repeat protein